MPPPGGIWPSSKRARAGEGSAARGPEGSCGGALFSERLLEPLTAGADVEQPARQHVLLALLQGLALPDALQRAREDVGGLGASLVVGAARHHVAVPLDYELV